MNFYWDYHYLKGFLFETFDIDTLTSNVYNEGF